MLEMPGKTKNHQSATRFNMSPRRCDFKCGKMTLAKHCPYCRHLIKIEMGQTNGICDRCKRVYTVKYHLTKITLQKEFKPRDYETEILAYITRKGKSYAGEISYQVGASKGVVSQTLHKLEVKGLVQVVPRGKTKWIILPGSDIKIR
jgi:hypothetical protein